MNRHLIFCLFSSLCLVAFPAPASAENTLEKIQRTGVLNVAIREDAAPFGSRDSGGNLRGYCLDFFALLESQLIQKLERNTLSIKLLKSTANNRFTLVTDNMIDLECGPNTIRDHPPQNIDFSNSFFITGTQFLVKKDSSIDPQGDLDGAILGVISNTTTARLIAERYPNATLRKYRGVTARSRGIQAVAQNKIDAMVSDGILLRAQAQQQELSSIDYPLVPDVPLTCDRYGMIIPAEDPDWQDFINAVIDSPAAEITSQAWFGNVFSYILPAKDFCQ
ncbi:MAG: amino acid ABC transporter substrate-binding protein [Cyanobacteria bacterium P01_C01_bin.72]